MRPVWVLGVLVIAAAAGVLAWRPDLLDSFLGARGPIEASPSPPSLTPAQAACGAAAPTSIPSTQTFDKAPRMTLRRGIDYRAIVRTSCGDFKMDLLEARAPRSVNNFVFLAKRGFYDGLVWHQVVHDYVIQTGDPNGDSETPPDGPGYTIPAELTTARKAYTYGAVAYGRTSKRRSAGSQFFVVVHGLQAALDRDPRPVDLDRAYAIFAQVGKRFFGSLENIARQPVAAGDLPAERVKPDLPIFIESVEITERRRDVSRRRN